MKILQFTSSFPINTKDIGGNFIRELIEELSDSFQFYVLTPDAPDSMVHEKLNNYEIFRYRYFFKKQQILVSNDSIIQNLKKHKLFYFVLPLFLLSALIVLLKIVNQKKIDIVHAHWIFPQGLIAVIARFFSKKRYKIIVTSHGTDIDLIANVLLRTFIKFTLKKTDIINPVSVFLKRKIIDFVGNENKICVIPMGTKDDLFGDKTNSIKIKDECAEKKFLLYVGRLTEGKDIPTLIRAFNKISDEFPDLFLYIIGEGNEYQKLNTLVSSLGINNKVLFFGQIERERLPPYFRKARILVSSSLKEGFGLVFVEALLSRCPVIATSVGGIGDIIIDNKTGILTEPGNIEAMYNSINKLLTDEELRSRLLEEGYKHAKENFSWNAVGAKYKELYLSINN